MKALMYVNYDDCSATHPAEQDMTTLSKYDAFWCAQTIVTRQPQVWQLLHERYPDKLYLHYVTPLMARPNAPTSYLNYDYINHNHPEWFLLMDENSEPAVENRIRHSPDDAVGSVWHDCFFLDVGNPAFQDWAVDQFMNLLSQTIPSFTGIMTDNILLDVWVAGKTKRHPNWKYANDPARWNKAYFAYLKKLHTKLQEQGYILVLNHTTDYGSDTQESVWKQILTIADGYTDEEALGTPANLWSGKQFERSLKHHDKITALGKLDWWIFYPDKDEESARTKFLYTYSAFLLCKTDRSIFTDQSSDWHPEYDIDLGQPQRDRHRINYVWVREFEHGIVAVNPTTEIRSIKLEVKKHTDTNGNEVKLIVQITMQPMTGLIVGEAK